MQHTGADRKPTAANSMRWGIGANRLCPRWCSSARSVSRPVPRPPSLSVPGSAGTRRAAHTSPGGCFRCAGFGSCSANRCGGVGLVAAAVLNPRAGARGFAARLCCPAAVLLPPSASGQWPWPAPLVRRSALWSVAPPGGFSLALGGGRFARPLPCAVSCCFRRSVPAPTPHRFGLRRLRRR